MSSFLKTLCVVVLVSGLGAGVALAASGAGTGSGTVAAKAGSGDGYEDFNPANKQEQVNAPLFVTIAYSLIWLVPLVYLIGLWRRQARLTAEVAAMRRDLGLADEATKKR
ncbi:MAG: hypothetical protein KC503_06400 [Myxococcales bacterium]|nr:hypothetical protein [Myxococcales bacterium]